MADSSQTNQVTIGSGRFKWLWRAGAIILWLLAIVFAVSVFGYVADDPAWREFGQRPAQNYLGAVGALLASVVYSAFGLAAWWLALLLALAGIVAWFLRASSRLFFLVCGSAWLLPVMVALLAMRSDPIVLGGQDHPLGGEAGQALAATVVPQLGPALSWFMLICCLVLGLAIVLYALSPLGPPLFRFLRMADLPPDKITSGPTADELAATMAPLPTLGYPFLNAGSAGELQPDPAPLPEAAPVPGQGAETAKERNQGPRIMPRQVYAPVPEVKPERKPHLSPFILPPLELLRHNDLPPTSAQEELLRDNSRRLEQKLADFGVQGQVMEVAPGPVVTMYEFKPAPGVKISRVAGLADDLAMNLKAASIRIVAPIPGKSVIGIEIPSAAREKVFLRELLASAAYQQAPSPLAVALGKDILGRPVVDDLARMPHLLIAGATGAGKSVFINTMVLSILYKATPEQVRLIMVDPKRIELSNYNDIPHLLYPVITAPKDAAAGLRWAVREMERRYELLAELGVKNIKSFNEKIISLHDDFAHSQALNGDMPDGPLPYILIIIDELADLMMLASKEVEALITRLAQMARAAGIHLVLATQRPSVDVITGLIKANFPARLSFKVSSRVDSRTILDTQGAEHLLGAGDMLFLPPGASALERLHGAYVSEPEIDAVVEFWKQQGRPDYDQSVVAEDSDNGEHNGDFAGDECYSQAVAIVKESGKASISYVQRRLRVGYNRAARMIEQMEQEGIVGPSDGSRPREVLIRD